MDLDSDQSETYIRRTIQMARDAAERGDRPCGSLLVQDGIVLSEDTNRVYTENDLALHPELSLARWADQNLSEDQRTETTLYTTVEPCSMCATAIGMTGLGTVVYCVDGDSYWEFAANAGHSVPEDYIPCKEVIDRMGCKTKVLGPLLESDGMNMVRDVM